MKSKKKLISILCITLVIMGVVYSLLSSTLNISGTSQASGTFNVEIVNMVETSASSSNGGAINKNASYDALNATFSASFTKPGDYVEYDVTVQNKGTIDAVLSSRLAQGDSQVDTNNNPIYIFTALDEDGLDVTQFRNDLPAGESIDITVKILFNEEAAGFASETANFTLLIDAIQESTSDYHPSERLDKKCFISAVPGEINFYDMSNPECGVNVEIPDGLRLPVTTIASYEYSEDKCMANVTNLKNNRGWFSYTDQQACNALKNEIESLTIDEILRSDSVVYVDFEFGEEGSTRNTITKVGAGTFYQKNIESVSFSNSITEIGVFAFQKNLLTSLTLPNKILKIGDCAFCSNKISGTMTFPKSITELGLATFESNQIQSVVFDRDSNLTVIPKESFYGNLVQSIILPDNIEKIGATSFYGNKMTTLDLQNYTNLKRIDASAFGGSTITTINFGSNSNLEVIGEGAFRNCKLVGTLTIPKSVKEIHSAAFAGKANKSTNNITSVVFEPASALKSIGYGAFGHNYIGGTLSLPDSLETLSYSSFSNNQIQTINIGSKLTKIGTSVFINNTLNNTPSITTINIDMTQNEWNTNVKFVDTLGDEIEPGDWYNGTPTINYNS